MSKRPSKTIPDDRASAYRDVAKMMRRIGPMSTDEVTQMFPHVGAADISRMKLARYIETFDRLDGIEAHRLTLSGRRMAGEDPTAAVATTRNDFRTGETYKGLELKPFSSRAGANDHLKYPSIVGGVAIYRKDANG